MTTTSAEDSSKTSPQRLKKRWYHPTVSSEHGAYVVLVISFLTGAAAAQQWTWATTLALICAYCGFQAEYPLALQIRQREQRHIWKPRFFGLGWNLRRHCCSDRILALLAKSAKLVPTGYLWCGCGSDPGGRCFSMAASAKGDLE